MRTDVNVAAVRERERESYTFRKQSKGLFVIQNNKGHIVK